jgi:hypothetical protein
MNRDARLMLDPGVTAIALRALRAADGHYPFLEATRRRRPHRWGPRVAAWLTMTLGNRSVSPVQRGFRP